MYAEFGGRQAKDEPTITSIDMVKAEHVAKHRA